MRLQPSASALAVSAFAVLTFAQCSFAQQAPGTTPAGGGGASNPALLDDVPEGPPPRLPDGTPDFSGVWVGSGPIGDISTGLMPGEELVLLPAAETLMK